MSDRNTLPVVYIKRLVNTCGIVFYIFLATLIHSVDLSTLSGLTATEFFFINKTLFLNFVFNSAFCIPTL